MVRHLPIAVVVFQAEPSTIHFAVAGSASRVRTMLLHLLPQRRGRAHARFIESRNIRRRRWRRCAENIVQHVLAADHDGGSGGIARYGQHAGLAQNARPLVGGQIDAPEIEPGNALDAVMLRQAFVQERILGRRGNRRAAGSPAACVQRTCESPSSSRPAVRGPIRETFAGPVSPNRGCESPATGRRNSRRKQLARGSFSMRFTCVSIIAGSCSLPASASLKSSSSGMELQRK